MQHIEQRIANVCNDHEHGSRWLLREAVSIFMIWRLIQNSNCSACIT
ncbi:MAG: hypothetical protein NVSMB33_17830 [Ktedonobacteraceae bacterium]